MRVKAWQPTAQVEIFLLLCAELKFWEYNDSIFCGGIAQLGELLPRKQGVIGSIPFTSTTKITAP